MNRRRFYRRKRDSKSFVWKGKEKEPGKRILIVCEGGRTEPNYFRSFRITSVHVNIQGKGMNTDSLVEETIRMKEEAVPAVIFLRPGSHPSSLTLGGDHKTYLWFRYIVCDLASIPAEEHMESDNIIARLNLPNMAFPPEQKIAVYASAQEGLVSLEEDIGKQLKYTEFIDLYAGLDDAEFVRYQEEYLPKSPQKEEIMGLIEFGRKEGRKEGERKGRKEGRKEGEVLTLNKLMTRRFGIVPGWAEERLGKAEERDLETWIDRVLDAGSVEEVFGQAS